MQPASCGLHTCHAREVSCLFYVSVLQSLTGLFGCGTASVQRRWLLKASHGERFRSRQKDEPNLLNNIVSVGANYEHLGSSDRRLSSLYTWAGRHGSSLPQQLLLKPPFSCSHNNSVYCSHADHDKLVPRIFDIFMQVLQPLFGDPTHC
jgi:hypothetical protein